jgi:hypothetical protein
MTGTPEAASKRRWFSSTLALASPHLRPKLSESKGGPLTPPARVVKPWRNCGGKTGETKSGKPRPSGN